LPSPQFLEFVAAHGAEVNRSIVPSMTISRSSTKLGRILGLDGRESYRELRLELLCCPHRLSQGCSA
jgi:hypothetical protein